MSSNISNKPFSFPSGDQITLFNVDGATYKMFRFQMILSETASLDDVRISDNLFLPSGDHYMLGAAANSNSEVRIVFSAKTANGIEGTLALWTVEPTDNSDLASVQEVMFSTPPTGEMSIVISDPVPVDANTTLRLKLRKSIPVDISNKDKVGVQYVYVIAKAV